MTLHESLGKILRTFELSSRFGRSEDLEAGSAKIIHYASGKRRLRTNNRKGHTLTTHKLDQFGVALKRDVFKGGFQSRAGIARRNKDLFNAGTLGEAPGQGVFAAAAADNKKLHEKNSLLGRRIKRNSVEVLDARSAEPLIQSARPIRF